MIEPQIVTKTIKTVVAGQVVSLGEVEIEDPSLVLSTYEVLVIGVVEPTIEYEPPTVELSYFGEGTITVTNPNPTALIATYDSVTRTITLVSNQSEEDSEVDVNLIVSLNRSGNCVTESVTLTVHCSPFLLDPQLRLTAYRGTSRYSNWITLGEGHHGYGFGLTDVGYLQLSFLGNGEITVSDASWDSSSKIVTVPSTGEYTWIISLSASPPYAADSISVHRDWDGPSKNLKGIDVSVFNDKINWCDIDDSSIVVS